MSTLGVFIALGGTSYAVARNSIGTPQIMDGAVTSSKVRNGTLAREDLAADTMQGTTRGPRGPAGPGGPGGAVGGIGPAGPVGPPGPEAAEGWRALPLAGGWTNYGGIWEVAGYRKDQLGIVHLRGLITKGDGTPGGVIATLPLGYRPQRGRIFAVHTGESPHAVGRVNAFADGAITWSTGAMGETDYTSLDGVSFDTD